MGGPETVRLFYCLVRGLFAKALVVNHDRSYFARMPLTNLSVAEEALSLSQLERLESAKLLMQSLEGDGRTDQEIKAELARRLKVLVSGKDSGLTFEQVFGAAK